MNLKYFVLIVVFNLLGIGILPAQEAINAAGNEASGMGGTSSYSIGLVAYTTNTGTNGSIAQGIQHPYEIFTIVGADLQNINIELSIYPNPTRDYLTLEVKDDDLSTYKFQLMDLQGKIIEIDQLTNTITIIELVNLPASTYFLMVTNKQKLEKTFKILKY